MAKIKVQNTEISVVSVQNEDYISLTDMAHSQMQEHIIFRWMSLNNSSLKFEITAKRLCAASRRVL